MIVRNARRKAPARKPAPNPLRADPSRTATLRRLFTAALAGRFARLRAAVVRLVDAEDAFGLRRKNPFTANNGAAVPDEGPHPDAGRTGSLPGGATLNTRFAFRTSPEQVRAFEDWLRQEIGDTVLDPTGQELYRQYVERGFRQGAGRAFDDARRSEAVRAAGRQQPGWYQGTRDEFLRSAFGRPVAVEKVKLLVGRVFTELKGVTEAMATAMTRTLADGLVRGDSPRVLARALAKHVDGIGRRRAELIAKTELIRCHAEGQLEALEQLGVDKIGAMVEWSTAGDYRVCILCSDLEGKVFTLAEARGLIPRHPACRCTWIPAKVGEKSKGNRRNPVRPQ